MARYFYETLTPTDYAFLIAETPHLHMHIAGLTIFEAGPLKRKGGGIDFDALKTALGNVLHQIPRYRQKLLWQTRQRRSPYLKWLRWQQVDEAQLPVWVDDPHFNLDYHVRHAALPRPGNDEQLRTLVARIASRQLDRNRPLWEAWIIEGLRGDRFALVSKMHHCMVDGKSGVDLAHVILHIDPKFRPPEPPPFEPRPAPTQAQLRYEATKEQFLAPWRMFEGVTDLWRQSDDFSKELVTRAKALGETFSANFGRKLTPTPLNGPNGPHRIVDWLDSDLAYIKKIRKAWDCTVNDVVLTIVTGAFQAFLKQKNHDASKGPFRIAAPVSIWGERKKGQVGNQIMTWTIELPVDRAEPREQLAVIRETTEALKESSQALGVKMITSFLSYTPGLVSLAARGAMGPYNSYVTNIPGPQFPIYLLGAQMLRTYPVVPLLQAMGMGIGVMSYNGLVCWGVTADLDVVPDLPEFMKLLKKSIARVGRASGVRHSQQAKETPS